MFLARLNARYHILSPSEPRVGHPGFVALWKKRRFPSGMTRRKATTILLDGLVAAGAAVGLENFFAQAEGFGGDFYEFVVGDELDGLLEGQLLVGDEAEGLVGARCAHVGELLFADSVDVEVVVAGVLADDHAFVDLDAVGYEEDAAVLEAVQRVGGG